MKTLRFLSLALATLVALNLTACTGGKKDLGEGGGGGSLDGDFVNGTPLPERQEGVSFLGSNVDRSKFRPVYFAFDSVAIDGGERSKIDEVASFLKNAGSNVIIAGFTDERGTPEYNRGLGERRAQAVREALIRGGVDSGKVQTVSFGAEMPAATGSGESAWARNRRAEFGVVR